MNDPDDITMDKYAPVFVISVAAQLAGMHPQTLRQYDRLGLLSPGRTSGRSRRYSHWDIAVLREVQRLSHDEGVNLAGIKRILELETEKEQLLQQLDDLSAQLDEYRHLKRRIFAASQRGDIVATPHGRPPRSPYSQAVVVWRPLPL